MRQGDVIEHYQRDHSWLNPCAEHEHDYIKGEALVLESEHKPQVLTRHQREQRVYVAGPMTGIADYNFPAFNAAADMLKRQGFLVENPADHGIVDGATWEDYFSYDLARLGLCGTIYLLPGWSHSKGATMEWRLAVFLKMRILFAPDAESSFHDPL
jgi:hypothetical protein